MFVAVFLSFFFGCNAKCTKFFEKQNLPKKERKNENDKQQTCCEKYKNDICNNQPNTKTLNYNEPTLHVLPSQSD